MSQLVEHGTEPTLRIEISQAALARLLGQQQFSCTEIRCLDSASKQQLWHMLLKGAVT